MIPAPGKRLAYQHERREIEAVLARTYPLSEIGAAQRDFLTKRHTGKIVLRP